MRATTWSLFVLPVVLVFAARVTAFLVVPGRVRGPQGEVVSQQLHDQRRVLVTVFVQRVQLGDCVIECLNRLKHQFVYFEFDYSGADES